VNKVFYEHRATFGLTQDTMCIAECNAQDYDIIFFVGGYGTMWDFPFDEGLANLTRDIYEKGGIVGGVCHGPIALANVKLSNSEFLVSGKNVTAFCNEEESLMSNLSSLLPEHEGLGKTCEDVLKARGAIFTKTDAWGCHVAVSERLFTGQNPASAGKVADSIVEAMNYMS
jgi:putative intracellular protease/amidase